MLVLSIVVDCGWIMAVAQNGRMTLFLGLLAQRCDKPQPHLLHGGTSSSPPQHTDTHVLGSIKYCVVNGQHHRATWSACSRCTATS